MKKIVAGAIIVAVAITIFVFAKGAERKIQFLQAGMPIALADVSILDLQSPGFVKTHFTTTADGYSSLPDTYKGGLISIKLTKQENVIADFALGDIPAGTTTIVFVSKSRTRVTSKKVLMGVMVLR